MADDRQPDRRLDLMLTVALILLFAIGPLARLSLVPWPWLVFGFGLPVITLMYAVVAHVARKEGITKREAFLIGFRRGR